MATAPKKTTTIKHKTPLHVKQKNKLSALQTGLMNETLIYGILMVMLLMIGIIRWKLIGMPLERDEGEYAYFGQLILKGIAPYSEAYNMKLPGIYYMYALIMAVFGQSYNGIHTGLMLMNAASMVFLFLSFKRFFNPMTGLIAAGFYGLMSITYNVLGFAAHATHFSVFYLSIALFFLAKYEEKRARLFALLFGLMLGMSFLMKQQAVYFILFGGIVFILLGLLENPINKKQLIINTTLYSAGVFIPYIIVLLIMFASGTFDKFWFWTVQYASKYASGLPWSQGKDLLDMTFTPIWNEFKWIGILSVVGIVFLFLPSFSWKQKAIAFTFLIFSVLTTTPGFYFRQHYFIVLLPAAALLAAVALTHGSTYVAEKVKLQWLSVVIPCIVFFMVYHNVTSKSEFFYSTKDPVALCKSIYGTNPFVESVEIAKYIKANSKEEDKIAVLGSEPQIAFYSGRKSATGHIYTYGLMEIHDYNLKMQEEMISEIEMNKPLFLIFCNVPFSWLSKPDSPKRIFEWYNKYATDNYYITGLVDIPDQGTSKIYWGADAQRNPQNQNSVWVFKRKDATNTDQRKN